MSERAIDHIDTDAELSDLLEAAEENASNNNEVNFVDSMTKKAAQYGLDMYMSKSQFDWLKSLAENK